MAVRIRLTRTGRKNLPSFRIAAFDGRTRRDGPALEVLGWFNPLCKEEGKGFKIEASRVEDWIRRGARLTMAVEELLERQGVKLALPAPAPAKAPRAAPAKKPAKGAAPRHEKMDPEVKARRQRRLAKRASRRAWLAKKAASKDAAAAAAAAPAAAGKP